jgi:phosphatidylserine decarboxylase
MRNEKTPIAVEGYPFIFAALCLTVVAASLKYVIPSPLALTITTIAAALTGFIIFFFRNPERTTPGGEQQVIAPADGVVIYMGKVHEPHLNMEMSKISIFMSVFNVHVNRAPVSAKVLDSFYIKGKFLDVRDNRATFENEQQGLVLETATGLKMVVVQVAGLIARRIVCYPGKGETLTRGERYGLIRFGSRLDVYLPIDTELKVSLGEKTVAGETILGNLS